MYMYIVYVYRFPTSWGYPQIIHFNPCSKNSNHKPFLGIPIHENLHIDLYDMCIYRCISIYMYRI